MFENDVALVEAVRVFRKRWLRRLLWAWTDTERSIPNVALKENEHHPQILTGISFKEGARILYGPTMAMRSLLAGQVAVGTVRHGEDQLYIWEATEMREPAERRLEEAGQEGAGRMDQDGSPSIMGRSGGRRWIGLFDPAKRRLYWGPSEKAGSGGGSQGGDDALRRSRHEHGEQNGHGVPNGYGAENGHRVQEGHGCRGGGDPHWSVYVGALLLAYDDVKNPDVAEIWPLLQEEWRERGCLGETAASRDAPYR